MSEVLTAPAATSTAHSRYEGAYWKDAVAPYAQSHVGRSVLDLLTSVVPYLGLSAVMVLMLRADISPWLVVLVGLPAAGFMLRTFIVFHDCTHGSFWPTKRGNAILGSIVGLLVFTPFASW